MSNVRYSTRHEDELISLYVDREMSLAEIEETTGVARRTVWNILVRREVPRRKPGAGGRGGVPQLSTVEVQRTVWLHEQRLTYGQIGEILGLTEAGIKHRIGVARRRLGYKGTNRGHVGRQTPTGIPTHVQRAVRSW